MHSYNGPLGLPFVFEDSTGSLSQTTLSDIYGRVSVNFDISLSRPDRSVTMIRILGDALTDVLCPNAVLEFGRAGALGSITYPPNQPLFMDSYLRKSSAPPNGVFSRRFTASDGQEYTWTLTSRSLSEAVWTCSTGNAGYYVASYELVNDTHEVSGMQSMRVFTMGDTFAHLLIDLLASLTVMRHMYRHKLY